MSSFAHIAALFLLSLTLSEAAAAQSVFERARRAAQRGAERAVEREVSQGADRATTAVLGAAEDAVVCVFSDDACIESARQGGEAVVLTDGAGNPVDGQGRPVASAQDAVVPAAPGTGAWVNYDFVPGDRVLFYDDYSGDRVGNVPARFEFVRGTWEVAEWQGRRLLRTTGPRHAALRIPLPETLPERFTIETEVHFTQGNQQLAVLTLPPRDQVNNSGVDYNYFQISGPHGTGVVARDRSLPTSAERDDRINERLVPIRISVDGGYAKVYVGENRTGNIPNAVLPRSAAVHLELTFNASEQKPMYLGPIRIAAGGPPLFDALSATGRVAVRGITFATASARIRPESTPTLREIVDLLAANPDLRLRIEGHTDDRGDAAVNLPLSERRAEAVRAFLVSQGVAAGRLEAAGLGSTQPVADNGSPEGREQNRRVELVRL